MKQHLKRGKSRRDEEKNEDFCAMMTQQPVGREPESKKRSQPRFESETCPATTL